MVGKLQLKYSLTVLHLLDNPPWHGLSMTEGENVLAGYEVAGVLVGGTISPVGTLCRRESQKSMSKYAIMFYNDRKYDIVKISRIERIVQAYINDGSERR